MAENYSFFNAELKNGKYDREYTASDLAGYFKSFVTNGVYSVGDNLKVTANGMGIKISTGKAFINGYFYNNTTDILIPLEVADGAQSRVDRVVVRLDLTNRYVKCFIKTGTTSAVSIAPELTRNSTVYELALADVLVGAGATSITASAVTDKRADSALCGFVGAVGEGTAVSIANTALTKSDTAISNAVTAQTTANSNTSALGGLSFQDKIVQETKAYYLGYNGGEAVSAIPSQNLSVGSATYKTGGGTLIDTNDNRLSDARRASNISMGSDGRLWISYS